MNEGHTPKREEHAQQNHAMGGYAYLRLALMATLSFVAMYVLMYGMVNAIENVYLNVNQFYMAGLMAAPMVVIELALMRRMYPNTRINAAIMAASVITMAAFWVLIRGQTAVIDEQFLKSMIPHHAGAILMCKRAPIRDPEIKRLCESIRAGQQSEIDQMKAKLAQLDAELTVTAAAP